jgi:hypothetical protein
MCSHLGPTAQATRVLNEFEIEDWNGEIGLCDLWPVF